MKRRRWLLWLILSAGWWACAAPAQEPLPIHIRSRSDASRVVYQWDKGLCTFTNGVVLSYSNAVLTANWGVANLKTGQIHAEGNVVLQQQEHFWRSESLDYNFLSETISAKGFRTGRRPVFAQGGSLYTNPTNHFYSTTNAYLTTDDVAEPAYRVRARELTVVPGKYFEAKDATFELAGIPLFYVPYYRLNLNKASNHFTFTPGYRSRYGPFLLGAYDWYWGDALSGALRADYRLKRGLGGGPDVHFDLGKGGQGNAEFYYLRDRAPGLDANGSPIPHDRHRFSFSYLVSLRTNFVAKAVVRKQSDAQVVRDFFESEYRLNPQPRSFAEAEQLWPNFGLDVVAQPRINDFYETIDRLPDVKLSAYRQQIGRTPLYYESESSAGYFRHEFADNQQASYGALRVDTYHQVVAPHSFFGWLNLLPRAGWRFTHYGETDGKGSTLTAKDRQVFNTGAEVNTKLSRVWRGVESPVWDLHGLRHILEPSVNYVYVPRPSVRPPELPQFDRELPTLRLLPIEFPDDNAIDSIDTRNVIRFSLWNKLQTKRAGAIDNVVNWALYTDWRLDPQPGQGTFSDVYSDLDFKPRSWLTFTSQLRYDLDHTRWRMANHYATIAPNDTWSWSIGHRYLRDDPLLGTGNNLITSSLYYRFNENWAARVTHRFEARDGVLEEQYYTLYRDLRSWTGALTLRVRDQRDGRTDVTVGVTFSLKAFPRYKLGSDKNHPSLLLDG